MGNANALILTAELPALTRAWTILNQNFTLLAYRNCRDQPHVFSVLLNNAIIYNTLFQKSNFHSIICQVVTYGRLKTKENVETSSSNWKWSRIVVTYERWPLTSDSKYNDLAWKLLVFWKNGRNATTPGDSTVFMYFLVHVYRISNLTYFSKLWIFSSSGWQVESLTLFLVWRDLRFDVLY